jgi:putative transposase
MKKPWRKHIRLDGYDYSKEGGYFITMCTRKRRKLFGKIIEGRMILNTAGKLALEAWEELPQHFTNITLDEFIIMPDHIHGIIFISAPNKASLTNSRIHRTRTPRGCLPLNGSSLTQSEDDTTRVPATEGETGTEMGTETAMRRKTLGDIIGAYKSLTANKYIERVKTGQFPRFEKSIWQPNYYEHIIRNALALKNIRTYIQNNPRACTHTSRG